MRGVPGLYAELFGYGEEVRRRLVDLSVSFSLRYYLNGLVRDHVSARVLSVVYWFFPWWRAVVGESAWAVD